MEKIGMQRLNERVTSLMHYLYTALISLKHDNGNTLIKVFGPTDRKDTGSNLILNVFDSAKNLYPFELIEQMAAQKKISIRSGCFCNPGIDEVNNCLTFDELTKYFSSRDKGDYHDMLHFLKKMRGANRISVGISTRKSDLDIFLSFIESFKNKQVPSDWSATAQTLV
jgi:molybdenum cofactor sulfurtransferase